MKRKINDICFSISNLYSYIKKEDEDTYKFICKRDDIYLVGFIDGPFLFSIKVNNQIVFDKINGQEKIKLKKNDIVYVTISSNIDSYFMFYFYPLNNKINYPYDMKIKNRREDIPLYSNDDREVLKPAKIETIKRRGGTYIYNNHPESIPDSAVNTIIMEQQDLCGQCFMTYENQNATESYEKIYLGYKLINNSDKDAYVTILNVGLQVVDSWLGDMSWQDYYGVKYDIDTASFDNKAKKWFHDYLNFNLNYTPKPITPTTYLLPKGKYIYVIGGKNEDNHINLNPSNTGNQAVLKRHCANGNVRFDINGAKLTGQFVCFTDENLINGADIRPVDLIKYNEHDDLGGRMGYANQHGVIDTNPCWIFDDNTPSCNLPCTYDVKYKENIDENVRFKKGTVLNHLTKKTILSDRWKTHLSTHYHHDYIGDDMVVHHTKYEDKPIILSTNIANAAGKIWDYGNWMIEYHDNDIFINQGNNDRELEFYLLNGGSIFYIIKDEDENILKSGVTLVTCSGEKPIYRATIKAHSRMLLSIQSVLPANNCGSVIHIVKLI